MANEQLAESGRAPPLLTEGTTSGLSSHLFATRGDERPHVFLKEGDLHVAFAVSVRARKKKKKSGSEK